MKNIFKTLAIVALGFFATSCVSADVEDVQVASGEGVVNFTVSTPGATSRAIADGKSATQLTCGVYDAQWNYLTKVDGQFDGSSLTTTVSIRLVNKKVYNFVFWAQDPDADCYTLTLEGEPNVAVTYNGVANDESRDAFFGQLTNLEVNGTMNEKVELTRPFAQINFGTLDTELAKVAGFDITVPEAKTTVTTRAYNTLYLGYNQHGTVGGAQDVQVTFSDAALPNEDLYLLNDTAHTTPYDWLAMNYILVPESESSLSECTLVVKDNKGQSVEVKYPNAPVKRNWRTNLVGNLLTDQVVIEVEILPIPEGEYNNEGTFASQLAAGGSILLKSDLTLTTQPAVSQDTEIDLNGYTIKVPATAENDAKALFNVEGDANLTLKNGTIELENSGTRAIVSAKNVVYFKSTGKLVIDGMTIIGSTRGGARAIDVQAGEAIISNSTFHCYYGSGVNSGKAKVVLNNCDITVNGMYSAPYNSVCFSCMYGGELTVNGGNYKIINDAVYSTGNTHGGWLGIVMSSGGTIILNDGTFENVPADGFVPAYERAIIEAENNAPAVSTVVFAGGKYKPQHSKVYSGYGDKYYPTWVNTDKLTLGEDGWYTVADNKGYVVNGDEYLVSTGAGLAAAVVDAPATANISLTADVDLTGVEYTPRSFSKLVFEGNNHTISGVKVENANQAALFGKTWNFDIKNVTLANSTFVGQNIDGEDAAAGFIGFYQAYSAGSKITNCHIENCTIGSAKYVGGLVAYKDGSNYSVAIDNCSVKNSTIVSKYTEDAGANYKGHVGGLVGYHAGDTATTITNCVVANNTFDVLGPRCGLFMGTAQMNIAVSGSVSGNAGLAQLCGAINKITDWSNVSVVYKVTSVDELNSALAQVVAGKPVTIELAGDFSDTEKKEVVITTAEGANVVIDAEGATLPKHFVVKLNKYADNNNDVKRANGRKGNYTLRKFNTEVLSVGVTGTTVTVTECTLEYLDFWGGNAAVAITDNTIDGKGVKHERIDGNLHNYGIYIALINYDLSIERNSVTNTLSHAIGINGLTSTFKEYASYNAYSTISSFTGNTLTKIGAYDNNRVGFKCWDDVTYAPTAAATIDDLPEAGKNLILAVDADATNVFSKDANSSNNAYKIDFFECKYAPLQ